MRRGHRLFASVCLVVGLTAAAVTQTSAPAGKTDTILYGAAYYPEYMPYERLYRKYPDILVTHNGTSPPLGDPYSPTYPTTLTPGYYGGRTTTSSTRTSGGTRSGSSGRSPNGSKITRR